MKFIYGKQDWKTFERGEENCCLMTNGRGGFSALTMIGSCGRNDHAVLMACVKSPNHRYNMIHRLEELLCFGDGKLHISSQDYRCGGAEAGAPESVGAQAGVRAEAGAPESGGAQAGVRAEAGAPESSGAQAGAQAGAEALESSGAQAGIQQSSGAQTGVRAEAGAPERGGAGTGAREQSGPLVDSGRCREEGYLYQTAFSYEHYPVWTYLARGVEVVKSLVLMQGVEGTGISYEVRNRSGEDVTLEVLPHLQFVPKGALLSREQSFTLEEGSVASGGRRLYFKTNGELVPVPLTFCEGLYYAYDACDGRRDWGRTAVNHKISLKVPAGASRTLEMVYGMAPELPKMEELFRDITERREALAQRAGFAEGAARALAMSAGQFVSYRASTAGQTLLAGYPFFEDWGRDTMIALQGCCLATRQYDTARSILQTFRTYCRKGLMPNLFPEGKEAPGYNTVDASLLFILAVYEYYRKTKDKVFVKSMYGTMAEIIDWYAQGTDYGIRMDGDGLIEAGRDYDQVTWMDVRVGEILPTPRHGKPVEINAYWYNALCIMKELREYGPEDGRDYAGMAEQVRESFQKFWNRETGCLKDVLSGTKADVQIRCNQIWAVSLPFSVLTPEQEKQVVEAVFRRLYTPYGLRTLDPSDEEFKPSYGGPQLERDLAYHQGTVWVFPLGGYYLAYLKVNGYSREAKDCVRRQLESLEPALREGCIGQLAEIYDGGNPVSSKGCYAQAWSVGEILRVYDALREA